MIYFYCSREILEYVYYNIYLHDLSKLFTFQMDTDEGKSTNRDKYKIK